MPREMPWWQDARRRTRAVVSTFVVLALTGMLYAGVNILLAGDERVLVVTMDGDAGQQKREALKRACGDLPGVSVVADRGNASAQIQGRFPVRFGIAGITDPQYAALTTCISRQDGVRGFLAENDGN